MNLDDRRMCAEFAGWRLGTMFDGEARWHGPNDEIVGNSCDLPAYESDSAAACSLLPKLADSMPSEHFALLMRDLEYSLLGADKASSTKAACRLIVGAVRNIKAGAK